jgi:topoisomerase-4 subunit A
MMKRAPVKGITRDKEYNIGREHKHTKILYFSANPNGEAETVKVFLRPKARLKNTIFEFDFSTLAIKGRDSLGNILTKNAVHKIVMKEKGVSTLGGRKIWFDEDVARLNADARGQFLGEFSGEDAILVLTKSGLFRVCNFDLSNHFEDDWLIVEKFRTEKIWSAVYFDADQTYYYVKRFRIDSIERPTNFIGENPESRLIRITEVEYPRLELKFGGKSKDRTPEIIELADFIGIKSYKAKGKRLSNYEVKVIEEIEPLIVESATPEVADEVSKSVKKSEGAKESIAAKESKAAEISKPTKKETASKKPSEGKKPLSVKKSTAKKKDEAEGDEMVPDDIPFEIEGPTIEAGEKDNSASPGISKSKEKKSGKEGDEDDDGPNGQMTFEW